MNYYCECNDFERPAFVSETKPKARKAHRCCECYVTIQPGERYERHTGLWDGEINTYRWCSRCSDVAAFIRAHVPCFCWTYHNLHDDALSCAASAGKDAPGLWFGTARRVVKARQLPRKVAP